jgi:ABC-type bacteriocin/lantibiotic exporter with double-glycine peptidase domain
MLGPILKMSEDILRDVPEISKDKKLVRKLSGKIEVRDLSFRYNSESPLILNRLSLTINPGEYIAIVGKSGCGKSTLMRILMGFEKASEGNVIYDDIDIDRIDPRSLRRNIGAVMQNGSLFNESIYQNIAISAPGIGMDAAWEVARKAGIAEDIENMPMKMKTLIPQGGGGISGGQKQRIMIARAIAAEPAILMFDEATSALDNITQKIVSDSLDELKCTRIVIAHRLSTIRNCDRILVLDKGTVIEQGSYDELIKLDGFFADLVKRQQL